MLYSFKGAYPTQLPNRIRLSDGTTRTDRDSFTSEEIADAGWFEVDPKPVVNYPQKVIWTGNDWEVRYPNDYEIGVKWSSIREKRNRILKELDYMVLKELETGGTPNTQIVEYRQALRDLPQIQTDPYNITWPVLSNYGIDPDEPTANTANT
jgi:hypothetical protein